MRVAKAVEEAQRVVTESSTALTSASPLEILAELGVEQRVEQLEGLREQLLRLSLAESHLSGAPAPTTSSTALVPSQTGSERVAATLQLWQQVFEDTLARYHRLSASLVGEDLALDLWRSQVETVTQQPRQPAALSYSGVREQLREVALQRSLLTQSQQLMVRVPGTEVCHLAERSKEALDLLEERSRELKARQVAWDLHTVKAENLAAWLREMEREKAKLNLKHVALRRVDKVLKRIEELLGRIPTGEAMLRDVATGQSALALDSFQPSALAGFRQQLHSIQERISSLQAGLRTWRDHLLRLQRLAAECREQEEQAGRVMEEQARVAAAPLPDSTQAAAEDLLRCQVALQRLEDLTSELEALATLQEELKECVSPSDIKQTTQRAWLLWQRQADLKHQLALRMQELEGRSALINLFWGQHARLLEWTQVTTLKLESASGLNTGLQAEVANREQELVWLERAGAQVEGQDRQQVEMAATEARKSYQAVVALLRAGLAHQEDSITAEAALGAELRALTKWLAEFEEHVRKPNGMKGLSEVEHSKAAQAQGALDREINLQSGRVSALLNDGEVLLLSTPSSQLAPELVEVEEAWTQVCSLTTARGQQLEADWERWQQIAVPGRRLAAWLEATMAEVMMEAAEVRLAAIRNKQRQLDEVMAEIKEKSETLGDFNALYTSLAREGRLDENGELKTLQGKINQDWSRLSSKAITLIGDIEDIYSNYESLVTLKESEMILLRQLDAELTEVQASSIMEDEEKRRRLQKAKKELEKRSSQLENLKKRTEELRSQMHSEDITALNVNAEEASALHDDVEALLDKLMDDLCMEQEKEKEAEKYKPPGRGITITVHKAKKLEKKGIFGKADPYILLTLGDHKWKSKTIKNNQNPEWQFSADLNLSDNESTNQLQLEVFDEDIGKDDALGSATLDLSQDLLVETWIPLQSCKSGAILVSISRDTKFEQDRGVQVDTLPPDSGFVSDTSEMARLVAACRSDISRLEESLDITEDRELLYSELGRCRASLELCRGCVSQGEEGRSSMAQLGSLVLLLEARIAEKLAQATRWAGRGGQVANKIQQPVVLVHSSIVLVNSPVVLVNSPVVLFNSPVVLVNSLVVLVNSPIVLVNSPV